MIPDKAHLVQRLSQSCAGCGHGCIPSALKLLSKCQSFSGLLSTLMKTCLSTEHKTAGSPLLGNHSRSGVSERSAVTWSLSPWPPAHTGHGEGSDTSLDVAWGWSISVKKNLENYESLCFGGGKMWHPKITFSLRLRLFQCIPSSKLLLGVP